MKAMFLKGMRAVPKRWCLTAVALVGFAASAAGASLTITSPGNSKPVALLSAANKAFYELSLEQRQENLLTNKGQQPESNAKPVTLAWTGGTAPFAVTVKSGLTGKILYPYNAKSTAASSLDLYNLELGATYTCTVTDAAGATATHSFTTEDQPPRLMNPFALDGTCRNMRDLGGWPSYDGRKVRQNQIVRAMAFDDGSGTAAIPTDKTSDCQQFLCNYLGIEYDFDLRPGSATYVRGATWLDASVDYTYLWDVESPHAARVIQLANRNYRPAYVHCQAGKDRTGIVCYLTLLALGVSENDAKKDYETTGRGVLYEHFINAREWLRRSYPHADMRDSAVDYLLAYGMTESQLATFRNEMLEDTPAMAACSHTYETVKAVAATCTTEGQTAYQRCTKCGRLKTFPRKLSAHGHAYAATVTKTPTTSAAGTASLTCTRCNKAISATLSPLGGESGCSFVEWIHPTLTTDRSAGSYIAFPSTVKLDYSDTVRTRVWVGTSSSGRPAHVFSCNPDAYGLVDSCGKLGWEGKYKTKNIGFSTKYWAPYQWTCGTAWDVETRLNASGKFEISYQSIDKEPPTGWEDHARASKSDMAAGDAGPLTLFAKTTADGVVSRADVRMYAFTVTDSSGKVKYDFKPALRNSDGVAGLYETQTKAFYASSCAGAPFSWPGAEPDAEEGDIDEPCAHPEDQLTALAEVAATCTADGRTGGWHCAACGKEFGFATVTKLGHDLQVTETPATCTATGTRTEKCRRTGCTYEKTTTLDKLPHAYDSHGKCTECGATDPGYNPGGDEEGTVTREDWGYVISGLSDGSTVRVYTDTSKAWTWTVPADVTSIRYLVVGGGAGGGGGRSGYSGYAGGGGGGGAAAYDEVAVSAGDVLTVSVGKGGAGGVADNPGESGGDSSLKKGSAVIAERLGGGGGGRARNGQGVDGGCGGGVGLATEQTAAGVGSQGGSGSLGTAKTVGGAGGGAGVAAGVVGSTGFSTAITGKTLTYGVGGPGGAAAVGAAAAANSGNGGCGSDATATAAAGLAGADGVVILRYTTAGGGGDDPEPACDHVGFVVTDAAVAATCEKTGLTEGSHCSKCSTVIVKQQKVAALGHDWDEGVVTTEPTETTDGVRTFTCRRSGCGATKTERIPATGGGDEPGPTPVVGEDWGYELTLADGDVVRVYTNTSGTVEWTVPANVSEITYLVVGGGGGGGAAYGNYVGGGGGGGFAVSGTVAVLSGAKLTVRVGAGGAGGAAGDQGQPGGASSLVGAFSVTAAGGGFGGGKQGADKGNGGAGGCGGGAAIGGAGGAGDPGGQGANAIKGWGGSGGGATGDGGQRYGSGGAGLVSPITGGEVEYGRGGVGAGQLILRADLNSPKGVGFGGSGGSNNGGAGEEAGAAGCDGVVIIRYAASSGPVHVHVEAEIPAVAPSCTHVGWTAGTKCAECGAVLVPPAEIPMLPHTYGEDGKCTGCGAERPAFHDAAYEYAQRDWSSAVVCWGDSLTRGAYSSQLSGTSAPTNYYPGLLTEKLVDNSYPCRLAARLEASGRPVFAIADDGCETARILAPTWLGELETPTALTLPATESVEPGTGCYCTNTVTGGRPPYCWLSSTMVNDRDSNRYLGLSGTFVANGEPLARVRVGGTNKFLYQQLDGEKPVEIPAGAKLETDVSKMFKGSINVFFAGCNDGRSKSGYIDLIDQAAAGVANGRYLVISPHCYKNCSPDARDDWHELTAKHSALFEAKFGERHLNLLAELDAKGVATAIELGALPSSMSGRNWYEAGVLLYDDQLHFNDAGYAVVAKFVHDKLTALGYLSGVEPSPSAAKVGDTEYPSVAAAVEAAKPGQTVVLTAQPTATIVMKGGVEVDVGAFEGVKFALPQGVDWFDLPTAPTAPGGSVYALVLNDRAKPVIAGSGDAPGFEISNGKVTVRIANAKPGLYYALESKADLLDESWQPIGSFTQDLELSAAQTADPTRFYRVRVSDRP